MKKATITIYDKKGRATRTVEAEPVRLKFGTVRKLIALLDTEGETIPMQRIVDAWDEVTGILAECFPDITEEELDAIEISEVVPVLIQIISSAMEEMTKGQPKN